MLKFQNEKTFDALCDEDVSELSEKIAPLVFNEELDLYAKSFDNFCYSIMEKSLSGESITFPRAKIKAVAEKLLQKTFLQGTTVQAELLT